MSQRGLRLVSAGVFLSGIVAFVLSISLSHPKRLNPPESIRPRGFTITSRQVVTQVSDGTSVLHAERIRYQKSDGTFKIVSTFLEANGKVTKQGVTYGLPGRGIFQVDTENNRLNFLSPMAERRPSVTESGLRGDPRFVREDNVLGYRTLVLKHDKNGALESVEIHYAVDLQGLPIKHTFVSTKTIEVLEPTMISLNEPEDSVFATMPDLPVNYEFYERDKQLMERAAQSGTVEQITRESLESQKAGNKLLPRNK